MKKSYAPLLAAALLLCTAPALLAQPLPDSMFADIEDTSLKDPDNPAKKFRIDFARVEHDKPLSRADLMRITPENIANLTQEQFDQIYGRITAGPIPDGQYAGDLFFSRGDRVAPDADLRTRLEQILGGLPGRVAGASVDRLEQIGRELWKGKVFFRDERVLRNMIENKPILLPLLDRPPARSTTIPRQGVFARLFENDKVWLLFPAKLYCGQSLVDGRRESVIVDYYYSDELPDYQAGPDSLGGRGGLRIRDEIRMIRPGFYLGRAYTNRMFLLNFTLFNAEVANAQGPAFANGAPIAEDCWPGEQGRSASR